MTGSTRDPMFDLRIAEWLDHDPRTAPPDVLGVVTAALPSIPQRHARRPRALDGLRITPGRLLAIAAVIAALALGAFAAAGAFGPTPVPPVAPSAPVSSAIAASVPPSVGPSAATTRYVSPRYGYSVDVGPDWVVTPATLTWSGPDNSPPVMDDFQVAGTDSGFGVASEALRPGRTFDDWLVPFVEYGQEAGGASNACLGGPASSWPPVQVGDHVGRWQQMCNAAEVVVEAQGRAYVFALGSATFDTSRHLSDDDFKAILRSVRFDATAVATPQPLPPFERHDTSPQYGFALSLPAGWTYRPATTTATKLLSLQYGDPSVDEWRIDTARLAIGGLKLGSGQSEGEWLTAYCQLFHVPLASCGDAEHRWPRITVGDRSGWLDVDGTSMVGSVAPDGRLFDAIVFDRGTAYTISLDGLVDRPLFEAILAAIQFRPPGPGASASP